jgi:hypothetical protein
VGQPYDPWWRDRPAGLGGLAPRSRSSRTSSRGAGSNPRSSSARSHGSGGSRSRRGNSRAGTAVSSRNRTPVSHDGSRQLPPTVPRTAGHGGLQERVDATLRELEEIKAGTHVACIAPVPPAPRRYKRPAASGVAGGLPLAHIPRVRDGHQNDTSEGTGGLAALLRSIGLEEYAPLLVSRGMGDVRSLLSSSAAQLQGMGMKMGHALRLLNSARQALPASVRTPDAASQGEVAAVRGLARSGPPAHPSSRSVFGKLHALTAEEEEEAMLKARHIYGVRLGTAETSTTSTGSSSTNSGMAGGGNSGRRVTAPERRREIQLELERAMAGHTPAFDMSSNVYQRRDDARALVRQVTLS